METLIPEAKAMNRHSKSEYWASYHGLKMPFKTVIYKSRYKDHLAEYGLTPDTAQEGQTMMVH